MKKIFSLMSALVVALAINAQDFYLGGINGSWPVPGTDPAYKLTGTGDELSASFDRIDAGSELKVFVGASWDNGWGAAAQGDSIVPNSAAYTLAQPANNLRIALADRHYLQNAVITYNTTTHALTVTGTDVDGSAEPDVYCLVGACTNNWTPADAIEFAEVNGVLTATVPDLSGGFKIIKNHKWGWEAGAATGESLVFNTDMTLVTSGVQNINLANPFGGYTNAVLTLDITNADAPVLKLIDGEFNLTQNDWFFPGSKLGWNCDNTTKFSPVAGKENTYEFLAPEFGMDFKVVYGVWNVEFGSPKGDSLIWVVNEPMKLVTPCDNVYAADNDLVLTDAIITIVVDYEQVSVVMTIEVEATALEQIENTTGAKKIMENGQVFIIKDGIRYTVKGTRL